jgi:NitT/TauT family transport system permease protein
VAEGLVGEPGSLRRPPRLRGDASPEASLLWGVACILTVLAVWYAITVPIPRRVPPREGVAEAEPPSYVAAPLVNPVLLPGPAAVFRAVPEVFREQKLVANTAVSLRRVLTGFGLAALVGVPLGILAACFPAVRAYLYPVTIFGRNIPIAALIPLTFALFGTSEYQKVMFLFIASVAFVIADATTAVLEVPQRYVDTALTLGANRRQIIMKVLAPLAAPAIFNSLRLLFGLAFGYVMLAELVKSGDGVGGLGSLINVSQRRGAQEPILIVLIVIPLVAYAIDRALWWLQCDLFPYRYGGKGRIRRLIHALLHGPPAAGRPDR